MDGGIEQQLICRACLRIVENKAASFGYIEDSYGNLKDMLMCCMPEMDIYVSSQPVMCFPCIQLLINVYNFKTRCLNTETIIRSYIQRNNLMEYNQVNLSCVVQELTLLNVLEDMNRNKVQPLNSTPSENPCILDSLIQSRDISDIQSKEGEDNLVENCAEELNRIEEMNLESQQIVAEPQTNIEQNNTVEHKIYDSNSTLQSNVRENSMEEPTYSSVTNKEAQDILDCGLVEKKDIIQKQFFPPQLIDRLNFPHYMNRMEERGFLLHPSNMHHNLLQNQMAEKMFALQQFHNMQPRMGSYDIPMRGQIPDRIFTTPPLGMVHRFPHYVAPRLCYTREGIQALPPNNIEQRIPPYGIPANHLDERIYLVPLTEEKIAQPVNGVKDNCVISQADKSNELDSRYCVAQKKTEEPGVPNKNANGEEIVSKKSVEEKVEGSVGDGKVSEEQPAENKLRIILRIDKSRIINFKESYDKNEDCNEKENEQEDVEMKENGMPPPENGGFLYPGDHNQELYQCSNCTFVTTNLSYHVSHKKICLNELEKNEKKCPHCPHVTNRQYALNKHINTMHTKAIWYTCDFCNYRSTDSSCLRRHKRNVHPERVGSELTCHLCSYRCMTEYHLRKHLLKHDENTTLQCQFCSYSTRDRSNFRKHIFIHNPKPKECEFCDYKCVSPYQMKVHLKKYHHGVGLEDIDCRSDVSLSEVVDDISNAIKESKSFVGHMAE